VKTAGYRKIILRMNVPSHGYREKRPETEDEDVGWERIWRVKEKTLNECFPGKPDKEEATADGIHAMIERIKIGDTEIGEGAPCFIVAELGVNHNRDLQLAKKSILAIAESGADAVKVQTWKTANMAVRNTRMAQYQRQNLGYQESQYQMLERLELPYEWHFELKDIAEENGLIFFSTMEDRESIDFLIKDLAVNLIKVGSGDLTNYPLLAYTAEFHIPLVLSTGLATLGEVDEAVGIIRTAGNHHIILLQCTTQYPAPYEEMNIRAMVTLKKAFNVMVGLSDHSEGSECAMAALALGASYIEKHFTLDRNLPGPDHKASLEPPEFGRMVQAMRNIEKALGDGVKQPSPSEIEYRSFVRRKLVSAKRIEKGEMMNESNVTFKRANTGLEPVYFRAIKGRKARHLIQKDTPIDLNDIE
jgi:N,N'-diacetyllegionaminate synthase